MVHLCVSGHKVGVYFPTSPTYCANHPAKLAQIQSTVCMWLCKQNFKKSSALYSLQWRCIHCPKPRGRTRSPNRCGLQQCFKTCYLLLCMFLIIDPQPVLPTIDDCRQHGPSVTPHSWLKAHRKSKESGLSFVTLGFGLCLLYLGSLCLSICAFILQILNFLPS